MSLLARVRRYAARHGMWGSETRVIAAVSGGSDSVGMLFLLRDLEARGELRLETIAHLNHQIRPEADGDEAFCRALAERLQLPFTAARINIPAAARRAKQSLELAGRTARRAFFDDVLRSTGADVVATAHTADDQAETVVLRLLRGTGQRGLAGIAPCRERRVRPVLCGTRAELRSDLEARGESWREDASNADLANPRNRVRHELLPYLAQHFNRSVGRSLGKIAEVARTENALLERIAAAASVGVVEREAEGVTLDAEAFRRLPEAIQRRVVLHALTLRQTRAASYDDVSRVVRRMEHFRGKRVLVSMGGAATAQSRVVAPFTFELSVPGAVHTGSGWMVEAEGYEQPQPRSDRPDVAQVDAMVISDGLIVRNRRPGDRLRPVGLGGTKKLQDVLVDKKVSRHERDAIPIVTDRSGRIVWVAGHVMGEEFRVTERTKGVIILKLRRV